jgi:DNA-binding NarL/FixJ family response regulator
MNSPIQVSLVEDDAGVRRELEALLNAAPGFHCLATYPDAETALNELPQRPPELVLMDLNLPGLSGIDCVSQLQQLLPALPVVVLTVQEDRDTCFASLAAGASAYLLKRSPRARLLEALREIRAGGAPINGRIARWVCDGFHRAGQRPPPGRDAPGLPTLTPNEEALLVRFAQGHSGPEIVAALGLSDDLTRALIVRIYEKLRVRLRAGAAGGFPVS